MKFKKVIERVNSLLGLENINNYRESNKSVYYELPYPYVMNKDKINHSIYFDHTTIYFRQKEDYLWGYDNVGDYSLVVHFSTVGTKIICDLYIEQDPGLEYCRMIVGCEKDLSFIAKLFIN